MYYIIEFILIMSLAKLSVFILLPAKNTQIIYLMKIYHVKFRYDISCFNGGCIG